MSMAEDRFAADGYKIIQSVEIGGMEIVIAENMEADKAYLSWRRSLNQPFGAETHMLPVYDSDYLKVLRAFIHTQSVCADGIGLDLVYRNPNYPLIHKDCVPDGMKADLRGKIVAIRQEALSPEDRALPYQIMVATRGFGCGDSRK
jgi:hypothetical protein